MRCGFYETEITPPFGTTIFGYFGKRVNSKIRTKLYAKAAVMESNGKYVAMLCLDCLGIPKNLAEFVRERVSEKTEIDKDSIIVGATHSHTSGPGRDNLGNYKDRVPLLENEPVMNEELDSFYIKMVQLLSADAVISAYHRLEEATVSFAIGEAEDVNFVREYVLKNGEVRTNPGEYIDEVVKPVAEPDKSLPVFVVKNKEGNPMGILTSFALHHDTLSSIDEISADYSGLVADNMKKKFGTDFVTVFYSGFCGNINHVNFGVNPREVLKTDYIASVLTEEILKTMEKAEPLKDERLDSKWDSVTIKKREVPKEHTERVLALKKNPPSGTMTIADPYCDIMVYAGANGYINSYINDASTEREVPVHVLRIGECLIYSFCGEIFSQFGDMIREKSPSDKLMLVTKANTDKIDCYVPTREMFLPNVYESTYTSATLCPDAGYKMVDLAIEMAEKIYNA